MKRPSAVSNTGPPIHLAKINRLSLLPKLYEAVTIPEEVASEAIVRGKEKGAPDALEIEAAMRERWLKVEKVRAEREFLQAAEAAGLEAAEAKVVSLARAREAVALIDEDVARIYARTLGVKVQGTLGLLLEAATRRLLTPEEAMQDLDRLSELMYLSADVYMPMRKALEELRRT